MTHPQQRALHTHRNHFLFADYYLDNRLPEWEAWQTDGGAVFDSLRRLWAAFTPHADNEAQTESDWIRPVLRQLGHTFNVQVALKTPFGTRQPDYVLYPDEASRQAAKALSGPLTAADLRPALAVADAKAWARDLDKTLKRSDQRSDQRSGPLSENPSLQIYVYVQHSGLDWGILTNGRLWRLVHRDSAEKLDVYYEVDLPALLDQGDAAAFNYFYLFFRREAFLRPPGQSAWLDQLLAQSRAHARGVSDNLKNQVYDALRALAQGFLDFPDNRLAPTPPSLKAIYDNSLIVLYRLLFILYAESRGLLPVPDNGIYSRSYSLDALKKRIARELDGGREAAASMAGHWERLRQLWQVIDRGNPDLEVPAYNGGLFKQTPGTFLEQYRVGDRHLRQAIDLLARVADRERNRRRFVDYRDLEIRHLGSIYEGLLEYQLHVADQPLAIRSDKGREVVEPLQTGSVSKTGSVSETEPVFQPGEVYLVTDKGERKATGSYYTPDYIVKYIVEQTVGPVLADIRARHAGDPAALTEALLAVNVLDPSMGSGHFLVEATDFIARTLVGLGLPREAGQESVGESDLAYWRRRVAQASIYGVDVNPLAVELAKLSLWLTTVARGKPLSFLDHHLRCGNSLIGARVADLSLEGGDPGKQRTAKRRQKAEAQAKAAGQLSMLDDSAFAGSMRTASGFMDQIETLRGDTLAEVQEAEEIYRRIIDEVTRSARTLADVASARHFGLALPAAIGRSLSRYLLHGGIALPAYAPLLAQAEALAAEQRFFHWELEFPEVFFDEHGRLSPQAGFDAIVGNPPYVRQEQMSAIKPYLAQAHAAVYDGVADIYVYFYHQGLELLRAGGKLSYIVTNKWLRAGYGEALRGYFAEAAVIEQIIDFGHAPIFADADTFPCIIVVGKPDDTGKPDQNFETQICLVPRSDLSESGLSEYIQQNSYFVPEQRFDATAWSLEPKEVDDLMGKIERLGIPLKDFMDASPSYGIKTGFNKAFLVDAATRDKLIHEDASCLDVIQPYLRGQDIKRWSPSWSNLWMILLKSSENHTWPWSEAKEDAENIFAQTYPSLYKHLKSHEHRLRKRQDQGRYWWELRSCTYYEVFEQPKIIHTDITWRPQFAFADEPIYLLNTAYMWPTTDLYLLAVVNSPLLWAYMWRNAVHGKDEALRMIYSFTENLPIAPPTDEIRAEVEPAVKQLIALTKEERQVTQDVLAWLQIEFGIKKVGQRLSDFSSLAEDDFIKEIKRRRPRSAKRLTPKDLRLLRDTYSEHTPTLHTLQAQMRQLEQRLADLVNKAYHLTPEEVALLWETAPPRMPVDPPGDGPQ